MGQHASAKMGHQQLHRQEWVQNAAAMDRDRKKKTAIMLWVERHVHGEHGLDLADLVGAMVSSACST
jgi:hypothetical protein